MLDAVVAKELVVVALVIVAKLPVSKLRLERPVTVRSLMVEVAIVEVAAVKDDVAESVPNVPLETVSDDKRRFEMVVVASVVVPDTESEVVAVSAPTSAEFVSEDDA